MTFTWHALHNIMVFHNFEPWSGQVRSGIPKKKPVHYVPNKGPSRADSGSYYILGKYRSPQIHPFGGPLFYVMFSCGLFCLPLFSSPPPPSQPLTMHSEQLFLGQSDLTMVQNPTCPWCKVVKTIMFWNVPSSLLPQKKKKKKT
jgi:hypothetical protein